MEEDIPQGQPPGDQNDMDAPQMGAADHGAAIDDIEDMPPQIGHNAQEQYLLPAAPPQGQMQAQPPADYFAQPLAGYLAHPSQQHRRRRFHGRHGQNNRPHRHHGPVFDTSAYMYQAMTPPGKIVTYTAQIDMQYLGGEGLSVLGEVSAAVPGADQKTFAGALSVDFLRPQNQANGRARGNGNHHQPNIPISQAPLAAPIPAHNFVQPPGQPVRGQPAQVPPGLRRSSAAQYPAMHPGWAQPQQAQPRPVFHGLGRYQHIQQPAVQFGPAQTGLFQPGPLYPELAAYQPEPQPPVLFGPGQTGPFPLRPLNPGLGHYQPVQQGLGQPGRGNVAPFNGGQFNFGQVQCAPMWPGNMPQMNQPHGNGHFRQNAYAPNQPGPGFPIPNRYISQPLPHNVYLQPLPEYAAQILEDQLFQEIGDHPDQVQNPDRSPSGTLSPGGSMQADPDQMQGSGSHGAAAGSANVPGGHFQGPPMPNSPDAPFP